MKDSGQLYAPTALPPGKEPPVPNWTGSCVGPSTVSFKDMLFVIYSGKKWLTGKRKRSVTKVGMALTGTRNIIRRPFNVLVLYSCTSFCDTVCEPQQAVTYTAYVQLYSFLCHGVWEPQHAVTPTVYSCTAKSRCVRAAACSHTNCVQLYC